MKKQMNHYLRASLTRTEQKKKFPPSLHLPDTGFYDSQNFTKTVLAEMKTIKYFFKCQSGSFQVE